LSQLSMAADQLEQLKSRRRNIGDSEGGALMDREILSATESVQRFTEAVRVHMAIYRGDREAFGRLAQANW
jgi:hypothetical protein